MFPKNDFACEDFAEFTRINKSCGGKMLLFCSVTYAYDSTYACGLYKGKTGTIATVEYNL